MPHQITPCNLSVVMLGTSKLAFQFLLMFLKVNSVKDTVFILMERRNKLLEKSSNILRFDTFAEFKISLCQALFSYLPLRMALRAINAVEPDNANQIAEYDKCPPVHQSKHRNPLAY